MNDLYEFYCKKYDLECLDTIISDKKVIFLVYDEDYYYYLDNNEFLYSNDNNILNIINLFNKKYKLDILNFYPVCFCKKTLVIALRTENVNIQNLEKVKYTEIDEKYKILITYHRLNFKTMFLSTNINKEMKMSQKYINRYKFHEKVIKKYILTEEKRRKKQYRELLNELIPNKNNSIIDVSCGDNSDIFSIAKNKKYKVIVGNDICLNYLNIHNNDYVMYTNDNVEVNKVKDNSFDVSFCKNTLHHMNTLTNIYSMLKFLKRISNDIIIIEIKNPTSGFPKFLNKYLYTKFLKDVGCCYLNEEQFKEIINNVFDGDKIQYDEFTNILGTFMIARISKGV